MKRPSFSIVSGRALLSFLAGAILLSVAVTPVPAQALVSLTEMARIGATDAATQDNTLSLFQGYLSLGLYPEAASLLERRVRRMILPLPSAATLFDVLVDAQSLFDSPEHLIAVCETAILNGGQTPQVLYFYGTGLRSIRGRQGEAPWVLARVGSGSPYHLLALYALGQIAAGRRDLPAGEEHSLRVEQEAGKPGGNGSLARKTARSRAETLITTGRGTKAATASEAQIAAERRGLAAAEEIFRRVEQEAGRPGGNGNLARRAARSRAQILIATGRGAEAAQVFEALLREDKNPLDRIGLASAGTDPVSALERLPAEITAGLPLKERIQFQLLLGGLARESGRHALAVERLTRAGEELEEAISPASLPPPEFRVRSGIQESLRLQIERLRLLRQRMDSTAARAEEAVREDVLELMYGLLLADWTVSRAAVETPSARVRLLTPSDIKEILRRIEEVALDGIDVDHFVKELSATLQTLWNVSRPPSGYLDRREKLQRRLEGDDEIKVLWEKFLKRRSVAVDRIISARDRDASRLLRDVWFYKKDLDVVRSVSPETWEATLNMLGIPRKGYKQPREAWEPWKPWRPLEETVREIVVFTDIRMVELRLALKTLEKEERRAAWDRRKPELIALRPVVFRQLADTLIAKARLLRYDPREEARKESFAALEQSVFLLSGKRLTPKDAADVAMQTGSLLAEGRGRWETFPGWKAGEKEKEMIARILPLLPTEASSGSRREESLYLRAALRLAVEDPGAGSSAREFLEKVPDSPLSADIGVRLGHESLLAGDAAGAITRYRAAAESGGAETSAVARTMLAWFRFQEGDIDGMVRELSYPLSAPLFFCGDLSPFEQEVVALSARAWNEMSLERLSSYPPVKAGTCGGKILLTALWETEENRGETRRAAQVRDVAAHRFPSDEVAAVLEMKTVEALFRTSRDREGLARALTLSEQYGPGSAWAQSKNAPVREKAAEELAGMLKSLFERKFDEGIRTGERSAMSSAATLMGEYFRVKGGEPSEEDGELRLKWAIALLGSGNRKDGVGLLKELMREQRLDVTGERAAVLYAETSIAGYERKESTAGDAEEAALLFLGEYPSEKAVSLALRASTAFLAEREYGRARRLAEEVEGSHFVPPAMLAQARLIQAEAALFGGDLAAARDKAVLVPVDPDAGGDSSTASRAKDIYLLSSLKEVQDRVSSGDPTGAAAILEELSLRFPDAPETPRYLLRAIRLNAQGGDAEGATRSGLRFLKEFPQKEETVDVAAVVGPLLEERKEFAQAGDLYEDVASRFPNSEVSPRFLFHAARLAGEHGLPETAERRFSDYRARYPAPAWMWTYATLSVGLAAWQRGDTKGSIRLMEEGLQKLDSGMEGGFPEELAELAGKARIAIGKSWAGQFRKIRLVVPLDKSLAAKDRLFRRALNAFSKAEVDAPLDLSLQASRLSGDLLVEYGKAILASQRPKGMTEVDREVYEEGLKTRARFFFERSVNWYADALERLEKEGGGADLAVPIRKRLETAQSLLESTVSLKGAEVE